MRDAGEALDLVAEVVEHHADLPLEAHFEDDVRPVGGVQPGAFGAGETFLGHHAFDELRHDLGGHRLIDDDLVFFFGALAGMNEPVGEVATVRQQDEPFAFFVETTDVVKVLELQRQQIVDRHALMRVAARAEVALRLVQGDDQRGLGADGGTIHDDLVLRLHLGGQLFDDVPVDGHTPAEDDLLRAAP
jgi:hypothetical protein